MKQLKTAIVSLLLMLSTAISFPIHAQDSLDLTVNDKERMRERVVAMVEEFSNSLSRMVNPELSHRERTEAQNRILSLFWYKGQPYKTELDGITLYNTGIKINELNINRNSTTSSLLLTYLKLLYNPETGKSKMRYSKISVKSADVICGDNIYREGDKYVCIAYLDHDSVSYIDGRIAYRDRTRKKFKCYITPEDSSYMKAFVVKLGDITVVSTERI